MANFVLALDEFITKELEDVFLPITHYKTKTKIGGWEFKLKIETVKI